ncbi:DarT ssDNA thymidine ADP-ribosyltransferase family protein [Alteromonas sp. 009811495]|uniref:DarT ssDNA thymidine ADP-ribosyltransferase family protein n=1 Tax=Alteromonas sp. 009811495 TaxID=3002962 RepID=UPI00237E086D|nr:DarT ssDNA thymidine ADP-ribosyltransferase family protein [Alteromonas sp. 009811495]WDT86989.1 DarT ssDNA thymidine ADP-ribosyltransferase family protein [Alteromonas sp. 009811495]
MNIPQGLKGRYAYHFTLIDNLESIIDSGLLCTNLKDAQGVSHEDIAEKGIQGRRSTMPVPCSGGKFVHDYVPFYFSKKTSMQLGVINKKNVDQPLLIYFAVPIEIIEKKVGVVFTDASANTDIPPNFYNLSSVNMLDSLNWDAIDDKKWGCPTEEYRHQKMAELLVPGGIQISEVSYIIIWNEWIKGEVEKIFQGKAVQSPSLKFDEDHYYMNFYDGGRQSIITGPRFLKHEVDQTISDICKNTNGPKKYESIRASLEAIARNFSSIKELDDIDGLRASYGPHADDVGTHSRKVAAGLDQLCEYNELSDEDKEIVLLSAYLHDIGKGPKSRWGQDGMTRADNDHAVKSLPMLKRILTEDIGGLSEESIRKIVILVTYDDLIGDIVARGRDEKQLADVIENENDLNMLIALGKADMNSINMYWVMSHGQSIETLKSRMLQVLGCNSPC